MKSQVILNARLSRLFGLIGWTLFAINLLEVVLLVYGEFSHHPLFRNDEGSVLTWAVALVKTSSAVLFCFLMQEVLKLLGTRNIGRIRSTTLIMWLTVASFAASAVLPWFGIVSVLLRPFLGVNTFGLAFGSAENFVHLLHSVGPQFANSLMYLLFALSIAILFRQLTDFVKFEAEVV